MDTKIPVSQDLCLTIADKPDERQAYPTSHLQKGLLLNQRGLDLAEEALGFGVPVLMRGLQALFPGEVKLELKRGSPSWELTAEYSLDRIERLGAPGKRRVQGSLLYAVKSSLSSLRIHFPPSRAPLMAISSALRRLFGWATTFEQADFSARVKMTYLFDERTGLLSVEADLNFLPTESVTEVVFMNEQGAHHFDEYRDSGGEQLSGKAIGCLDQVSAAEASFASSAQRIAFTVLQAPGARLFRGRELVGSRLAWAGFAYSMPPTMRKFSYTVDIKELA
jgi:hypothetical protein